MERATISADGTRIRYRIHGSGTRAVALVHGWMMSGAVFSELLDVWQPEGYRLIVPDLRSTGASGPAQGGYDLDRYVEDMLAVLDAEAVQRAVLLGHSMGGQIAQLVAATQPERVAGLVAVLPVPVDGLALPEEVGRLFRLAGGNGDMLGRILDMASPGLDGPVRARLLSDALRVAPDCVSNAFDTWTAGGAAECLDAVRAPTLIVASDDAFLPSELLRARVVQRIRGARLAKVHGAGHYVANEQPRSLAAVLEGFIAGLGDDASR